MKRRHFLILGAATGIVSSLPAKSTPHPTSAFRKVRATIAAVQAHMFPIGGTLPSATEMDTIGFLEETLFHPTYDRDIRAFVIEGAQELERRTDGEFLNYDTAHKEQALRAYEQTGYGANWLSRIMTLSMEALFGDPIYGSNKGEAGWKALKSFGGEPRPRSRYINL